MELTNKEKKRLAAEMANFGRDGMYEDDFEETFEEGREYDDDLMESVERFVYRAKEKLEELIEKGEI